jgi:hypothetical protein
MRPGASSTSRPTAHLRRSCSLLPSDAAARTSLRSATGPAAAAPPMGLRRWLLTLIGMPELGLAIAAGDGEMASNKQQVIACVGRFCYSNNNAGGGGEGERKLM